MPGNALLPDLDFFGGYTNAEARQNSLVSIDPAKSGSISIQAVFKFSGGLAWCDLVRTVSMMWRSCLATIMGCGSLHAE